MAGRFKGLLHRDVERWDGTSGPPRSSNRASSFHLTWDVPDGDWVDAQATLEVSTPPSVPKLAFWAMQVSFVDRGRRGGAAHLGLQWHAGHPENTAVNWGGYGPEGGELEGSGSPLPSATGNVNTRDFAWQPGRPYRLRIRRSPDSGRVPMGHKAWRGEVTDLTTGELAVVRELWAEGNSLASPVVWAEIFADCDDPTSMVRWSALELTNTDGDVYEVESVRVNYQSIGDGGCAATNSSVEGGAVVQRTSWPRITPQGATLRLS